jgi:type II secretory pathway component HofQ
MLGQSSQNRLVTKPIKAGFCIAILYFSAPLYADKIDMQAMQIPAQEVFVRLAAAADVNLVMRADLNSPVHMHLQQLSARQSLHMLCQTLEVSCYWYADHLGTEKPLDSWQGAQSLLVTNQQLADDTPLELLNLSLRYAEAEQVAQQLKADTSLLAGGQMVVDSRSQSLLLRVPATQIETLVAIINSLDKPLQQVHIEARIAIATNDVGSSLRQGLGLQLSQQLANSSAATSLSYMGKEGANNLQIGLVGSHILLNLELAAMEASGQVLTLAQPQVLVQEGQQGLIETGQEVPYILNQDGNPIREWKQAVLGLTVTPRVLAEDQVELDLAVVQDSIGELLANGELALNTHRLQTKVRMDMGQTLVLGGALYEQQLQRLLHNPKWLSVPIFNRWLKQQKKQSQRFELLVFVTPKLIS